MKLHHGIPWQPDIPLTVASFKFIQIIGRLLKLEITCVVISYQYTHLQNGSRSTVQILIHFVQVVTYYLMGIRGFQTFRISYTPEV